MNLPHFIAIDLSKSVHKKGSGTTSSKTTHPDISTNKNYLVKVYNKLMIGTFAIQWYGLSFHPIWACSSIQYDAPGTNSSGWEAIWEIQ